MDKQNRKIVFDNGRVRAVVMTSDSARLEIGSHYTHHFGNGHGTDPAICFEEKTGEDLLGAPCWRPLNDARTIADALIKKFIRDPMLQEKEVAS